MTDPKEGTPQKQASGRWVVCRPSRAPIEITGGELVRVEVDGKLEVTRMEFGHAPGGGDGYHPEDGVRPAIGGGDFGG